MKGPFAAVIFDLDGTLVDSIADIAASFDHALSLHGLPGHSVETYKAVVGASLPEFLPRLLGPGRADLADRVATAYRAHYALHFADRSAPFPGIPALLDALEARGCPSAVVSNKRQELVGAVVATLFPGRRFAGVVGEGGPLPCKPHPAAALDIARTLAVPPAACALVGDTRTDMQTAVAAGMVPVGALWGYRSREELLAHGARVLLAHPLELLDVRP